MNEILLKGIVGSTAYGLAHEGSDLDYLGVFAAPTTDLLSLHPPKESQVTKDPDTTLHEARKFVSLCLGGNPTVFELLWLDAYEVKTPLGEDLIRIRETLLGARRVRDAYLGYAWQQSERLNAREFSETTERDEKHARHLVRLARQGLELYTTGKLTLRLENPEEVRELGARIARNPSVGTDFMEDVQRQFDPVRTVLPEKANEDEAERWLQSVRLAHWLKAKP